MSQMSQDIKNQTVHCSDCNPPSTNGYEYDEWKCEKCGTNYKLDRAAATWWPEQWWPIKEEQDKQNMRKEDQ